MALLGSEQLLHPLLPQVHLPPQQHLPLLLCLSHLLHCYGEVSYPPSPLAKILKVFYGSPSQTSLTDLANLR